MFNRITIVLSLVVLSSTLAEAFAARGAASSRPLHLIDGRFQHLVHAWNDTDFDPTPRYFDVDGQTQGQVATFFTPTLRLQTNERLARHIDSSSGGMAGLRNDPGMPNQFLGGANDSLAARHKEFGSVGPKTASIYGSVSIEDPSRLLSIIMLARFKSVSATKMQESHFGSAASNMKGSMSLKIT